MSFYVKCLITDTWKYILQLYNVSLIFFKDYSQAFTTKIIDINKDSSLQQNFDRGWQINNAIIHQRKVGTNQLWAKVLSFLLQLKKRGGGKKQNPRVLEFLFKELPSKRYDADVIQGCLCILDTKVYFFIWWYLLRPSHWYLWQSWWLLFYHLSIQLQHKL